MKDETSAWQIVNCRFFINTDHWEWNSDYRPHYNLWIATQGGGWMWLDHIQYEIHPGVVFLFDRNTVMRAKSDPSLGKIGNFTCHFHPNQESVEWLGGFARQINGRSFRDCLWLIPALRDLARDFSFGGSPDDPRLGNRLRYIFGMLENEPDRPRSRESDREIGEVVERIRRNPAAPYSVEEMARSCSLSVSRFSRRFRDLVGMPPNRFLVQERLRTAEMLLLGGNDSVEKVAEQLGYRDVYFFSRQFRQHRGVSPSRFRKGFSA